MKYTKDHILSEIRRTAIANKGTAVGRRVFEKETGIKVSDWSGKIWVKWSDAVKEAGLAPNEKVQSYDEDLLLQQLALFIREKGHYPVTPEFRMKSREGVGFPDQKTFAKFGTKDEVIARVIDYCESHDGFADVAAICRVVPPSSQIGGGKQLDTSAPSAAGFVYLMKSGKRYKIGKTESLEKRFAGLSAQVSHELIQVHAIATDDPSGIEAYWHNRFRMKRKFNEWFELSAEDVAAFRKRKFM